MHAHSYSSASARKAKRLHATASGRSLRNSTFVSYNCIWRIAPPNLVGVSICNLIFIHT